MPAWTTERIQELIDKHDLAPFYNSSTWRRLKGSVLADDKNECQKHKHVKHKYKRASTVHHVKHVKKFPALALSRYYMDENGEQHRQLISLCSDCHREEHPEEHLHIYKEPLTPERW